MSTEVAERCGEDAMTGKASSAGPVSKGAHTSRSDRPVDTVASVPDSSFFAGDLAVSDAARAALKAHRGSDWFARLGALALVCAAHAALLAWLVLGPSTRPVRLSPPAVIGELVTIAPVPLSTRPSASPETRSNPQLKPPPRAAVRPAPAPHPEPRHEPRPEPRPEQLARPAPTPPLPAPEAPPSDRAPSVPAQASVAPPSEAPQRSAATASPAPATPSAGTDRSEAARVTPPRSDASALNNPAPPYPRLARSLGQEGRVLLDVYILADGSVGQIRLHHSSGYPLLDQAAIAAVRGWHYIPAKRGGVPIPYWYLQPIDFELQ